MSTRWQEVERGLHAYDSGLGFTAKTYGVDDGSYQWWIYYGGQCVGTSIVRGELDIVKTVVEILVAGFIQRVCSEAEWKERVSAGGKRCWWKTDKSGYVLTAEVASGGYIAKYRTPEAHTYECGVWSYLVDAQFVVERMAAQHAKGKGDHNVRMGIA